MLFEETIEMLLKLLENASQAIEGGDEILDIRTKLLILLRNLAGVNTEADAKRIMASKGINQVYCKLSESNCSRRIFRLIEIQISVKANALKCSKPFFAILQVVMKAIRCHIDSNKFEEVFIQYWILLLTLTGSN